MFGVNYHRGNETGKKSYLSCVVSLNKIRQIIYLFAYIINSLLQGGVTSSDIGVIAPYRDQVSLLRRTLVPLAVEASTVDQFQGRDKSVIIYSCTKKDDGQKDKTVKVNAFTCCSRFLC